MGEWQQQLDTLKEGGFTDSEITDFQSQKRQELAGAGFMAPEIDEYFGVKQFDPAPAKALVSENIKAATTPDPVSGVPKKQAATMLEALEAGWDMSVTGLISKAPDVELGGDAGMFMRLASQVGTLAGDLPAMVAGGLITGVGTSGTMAAAGAFALPAGMRKVLMDHYEKGDVKDFGDFWERTTGAVWEEVKGGITGAATVLAGGAAGKLAKPFVGPVFGKSAQVASEVATMVTVGKALEGQAPKPADFLEAAILVGGMHAVTPVASKLRQVYKETGARPSEVALEAQRNPLLQQELMSDTPDMNRVRSIIGDKPSLDAPKDPLVGKLSEQRGSVSNEPKPGPAPEIPRSEAEKAALDKITTKTEAEKKTYSFDEAYKDLVDRLDPIKKVDEPAYQQARMANDYRGKAKHAIEYGTLDFKNLEVTGKGIKEIVSKTPDKQGLDAFLFARTELERAGRGLETRIPVETAQKVVSEGSARFEKIAEEITEFSNRNLEYLKDSGIVSDAQFRAIQEANKNYAPLKKVFEPEDVAAGKRSGKAGFLKTAKGGTGSIQSPLVSILENTETIFKMAEKNRATKTFVDNVLVDEGQTLLKKVKSQSKVVEASVEEVQKWLDSNGIEADASKASSLELFRRSQKYNLGKNEFEVFRDGKREVYETDPMVAEAVKSLDGNPAAQSVFMRMASGVTQALKIGTTVAPDFVLRNAIRDQITTGVFTKGNTVPFAHVFEAMGHLIKKDEVYQNWLKSGGSGGSFLKFDEAYFHQDILGLQKETGFMDSAKNLVKFPVDAIKFAGYITESAPRLAEFKAVSKGATSGPDVFKGGFAAREVTLDFQRMGAKVSAWNAITAFMNVQVQGLDKTVRTFKENPAEFTAKGMAYITTPSVLLWWANHDEKWYKALPQWEKDLFWHIEAKGTVFRIPKPMELGVVFGSVPERVLEKFVTDNPRAMKGLSETIQQMITPSLVPDIVRAPLEQMVNKSLFTGGPVVSWANEKFVPAEQYTDYTSETAKQIAKMIAVVDNGVHSIGLPSIGDVGPRDAKLGSPQVIENYVRAWSGQLGSYAMQAIDQALYASGAAKDLKPASTLADIPFVKAFVSRYPRANAQPVTDFQDRYIESKKFIDTAKMLVKTNQNERALEFYREHKDDMVTLQHTKDALDKHSLAIRKIYTNPSLSKSDKRQIIDGLYYGMIQAATNGNKVLDTLDKKRKALK